MSYSNELPGTDVAIVDLTEINILGQPDQLIQINYE